MINGIVIINKEKGYTSHDVCAKVRGILGQKKVGHTGTLDPDATGVLPVCLGNATKLCDVLTDKTKEYVATLLLGTVTDTLDIGGTVLSQNPVQVSEEEIKALVLSFLGKSMQIPPMYSALKQNGKKLYELARAGIEVERQPRPIEIFEIEVLNINLPRAEFRILCSKGTYIRSLCDDIGKKLGCGACMENLRRIRVENFYLKDACLLQELEQYKKEGRLCEIIIPVDRVFKDLYKATIKPEYNRILENGNTCTKEMFLSEWNQDLLVNGQRILAYHSNGEFYGIYEYFEEENILKPYKMFIPG